MLGRERGREGGGKGNKEGFLSSWNSTVFFQNTNSHRHRGLQEHWSTSYTKTEIKNLYGFSQMLCALFNK